MINSLAEPTASLGTGTILNLKPIIKIKSGVITVVQKTRGNAKAYKWILNKLLDSPVLKEQSINDHLRYLQNAVFRDKFKDGF